MGTPAFRRRDLRKPHFFNGLAWHHHVHSLISLHRLPFLAALLLVLAANTSAAPTPRAVVPPQTPPKIGQQAPTFTLRDQNGKRVSLADAAGTKVVLVFYRGYW